MTSLNDTLGKLSASIIVFWDGHVMIVGEDVVGDQHSNIKSTWADIAELCIDNL